MGRDNVRECKTKGCGSYAINEHPESGFCDRCYWKDRAEQATMTERARCLGVCQEIKIDLQDKYPDGRIGVGFIVGCIMLGIKEGHAMREPNWKHDPLSTCVPHIYERDLRFSNKWLVPICNSKQSTIAELLSVPEPAQMERACKRCQRIWEKKEGK
jgi:hypothetical protein